MNSQTEGITILGSTGSIGVSTLSVIRQNPEKFHIDGLSCHNNIDLMVKQIEEFTPSIVSVSENNAASLKKKIKKLGRNLTILEGNEGHMEMAEKSSATKVVAAMVGAAGIEPVFSAIRSGKDICLANKESMVLAGSLLISEAKKYKSTILPVDSEHNAIFQSLKDDKISDLHNITLTASGGPFRNWSYKDFHKITIEDALNHPNWSMGKKISIDSATMMNKCLEVIEAKWLFNLEPEQIEVLIHPQSIVHSMVSFRDGSTICQMGVPDMRIPIANCLGYPDRIISGSQFLDLAKINTLTFEKPDLEKFPTIQLAFDVLKLGGGSPAALNGANEVLVQWFLDKKITFIQIFESLKNLVDELKIIHQNREINKHHYLTKVIDISDAIAADGWGRNFIKKSTII